jgi:predicted signal transduction protein with EAL and GGDEF domain
MLVAVRTAITAALDGAGIPTLTASFGVVEAHASEELPTALARADAALFEAKRTGRDRIVVHDPAGRSVDLAPSPATVSGPRVDGSSQVRRPAAS